jgi:hypothetical protein
MRGVSEAIGVRSVSWIEVRARRLARSSLVDRTDADRLVEVVREVGGVHAQIQASAELQLGARVDGVTRTDVRRALWEQRALVKAWTLRGTLHLHPADELALWHAARKAATRTSTSGSGGLDVWRDPGGVVHPPLGAEDVRRIRAAVWDALDGRTLLRKELADEVVKRVGPAPAQRLRSGFAFFLDELCQGPPRGARVTFVRPDQWIEGWKEMDEHEALLEVCRRFLRTYGPARPVDFQEWIGGRGLDARGLFDELASELEQLDIDGHRAYVLADDGVFPASLPSVRLLPEYDVYAMGFRERERLVPEAIKEQVASHRGRYEGPAGVRFLLIEGQLAGLWERKRRGKQIELRIAPAHWITKAQRAGIDEETARIGTFLGLEPVVTVG